MVGPDGARWSPYDAADHMEFNELEMVARGGIELPTRGFSGDADADLSEPETT